jgi:hypothetical protein
VEARKNHRNKKKEVNKHMTPSAGNLRTCPKGHKYYKSSDCPLCPACEKMKVPEAAFLSLVAAPARRALERAGISTLSQLSAWSEETLLELHGMGPNAIAKLRRVLEKEGMTFKK